MRGWQGKRRLGWLFATVGLFLFLAAYQLGLPGLHYDEAKEAGVNAMELLQGAPVTAFRGATVTIFGLELPLMVQDYIGALNVYLAVPFLAATGIGVPNLRLLPLFLAVLGLLAVERTISEWLALCGGAATSRPPIAPAALAGLALLALGPSFVFWQRQGIFVTNATFPFTFACIWLGLRWLRLGESRALVLSACSAGLALYAKLLAGWIVLPFGLLCAGWWLWQRRRSATGFESPHIGASSGGYDGSVAVFVAAAAAFVLPLVPFILFNLETGGTLASIISNAGSSYYGVNNADIVTNAAVRWQQLLQTLRGNHLWYLGTVEENPLAPWLTLALPLAALSARGGRRVVGPPLLLLALAFASSFFTVSDLFVTHFALLQPLVVAVACVGLHGIWGWPGNEGRGESSPDGRSRGHIDAGQDSRRRRIWGRQSPGREGGWRLLLSGISFRFALRFFVAILICANIFLDLRATAGYHSALTGSGGLVDHADASYHLAYDLRYGGMGAPIVLDWGMEAPIRFLSEGSVTPIEIFGYASLGEPDEEFGLRLAQFLGDANNVYLLRTPGNELFRGRRAAFERLVKERGGQLNREQVYSQQDGTPLFERWRVVY